MAEDVRTPKARGVARIDWVAEDVKALEAPKSRAGVPIEPLQASRIQLRGRGCQGT